MSLAAPCEGAETIFSTMGLRLRTLGETMPPEVAIVLPLEVVPSSSGRLLFRGHDLLERPIEDGFGRG